MATIFEYIGYTTNAQMAIEAQETSARLYRWARDGSNPDLPTEALQQSAAAWALKSRQFLDAVLAGKDEVAQ